MISWSDISTAPKDGTIIIGFPFFGGPAIAYWRNGCWCVDSSSQDGMDFENIELTHWSEANNPLEAVISLEEWSDYSKSAGAVRCIEHNLKSGNRPRLLIAGVKNVINHNGFVPEDKDYALELIGEKTPEDKQ